MDIWNNSKTSPFPFPWIQGTFWSGHWQTSIMKLFTSLRLTWKTGLTIEGLPDTDHLGWARSWMPLGFTTRLTFCTQFQNWKRLDFFFNCGVFQNLYYGNAGDSLYSHNGLPFSTFDVDNDNRGGDFAERSCARLYKVRGETIRKH